MLDSQRRGAFAPGSAFTAKTGESVIRQLKFAIAAVLISVLAVAMSAERAPASPFRIKVEISGSEADCIALQVVIG